jgi:hypothetical protein
MRLLPRSETTTCPSAVILTPYTGLLNCCGRRAFALGAMAVAAGIVGDVDMRACG